MFVNRIRIRVEFGDCDPAQIVFYANYFRWFDNCTSGLFRAAGLPLKELFKEHGIVGIPIVEARARFILPVFIRRRTGGRILCHRMEKEQFRHQP